MTVMSAKRKKKRKQRIRLIIFFLIAAIVAALYFSRSIWLGKLKGMGKQHSVIINDGVLAQGNYPIEVSGGNDFQIQCINDDFAVLTDAYLFFYDKKANS